MAADCITLPVEATARQFAFLGLSDPTAHLKLRCPGRFCLGIGAVEVGGETHKIGHLPLHRRNTLWASHSRLQH